MVINTLVLSTGCAGHVGTWYFLLTFSLILVVEDQNACITKERFPLNLYVILKQTLQNNIIQILKKYFLVTGRS